jgi:hypothetical protein
MRGALGLTSIGYKVLLLRLKPIDQLGNFSSIEVDVVSKDSRFRRQCQMIAPYHPGSIQSCIVVGKTNL